MSLRLSSLASLSAIATLFLAAACTTPANIAGSTGGTGGGSGGTTVTAGTTTGSTSTAATTSSTGGGACTTSAECGCGCGCVANACECTGVIPPSCLVDTDCGPACAGLHCADQKCEPVVVCSDPCPAADVTRCTGTAIETCMLTNNGCLSWTGSGFCGPAETCNSDGTKCITPPDSCTVNADCGCGCGCVNDSCKCTGAIPPSCVNDADCGPPCLGAICFNNECALPL